MSALAGREVARVGFGAMQLPGPGVLGPPRDCAEALAVLRRAVELGVNHIDTAQFYGPDVANELIREALHPYPDDLVLVSKVGARPIPRAGGSPPRRRPSCAPRSRRTCAPLAPSASTPSTSAAWTRPTRGPTSRSRASSPR